MLIIKYLTDFLKTVVTGMDPRLRRLRLSVKNRECVTLFVACLSPCDNIQYIILQNEVCVKMKWPRQNGQIILFPCRDIATSTFSHISKLSEAMWLLNKNKKNTIISFIRFYVIGKVRRRYEFYFLLGAVNKLD